MAAWPGVRTGLAVLVRNPWIVTVLLSLLVIWMGLRGPDLPAQDFRTWIARHSGFVAFNNLWYDGHSLPGYSVLFPSISAMLGARTTGMIACALTTWAGCRLIGGPAGKDGTYDSAQKFFRWTLAIGIVGELVIGQIPFALGLAFGVCALLAANQPRHWRWWTLALVLSAACSLSSPLAGLFLLLAGAAWLPQVGLLTVAPLGAAGLGMVVSALTGGSGGRFPFTLVDLIAVIGMLVVTLAVAPKESQLIRRFAVLYAIVGVALFLVPNPVGANFDRLERTLALPAAGYLLIRYSRRRTFALVMIPVVGWQFLPVASAVANSVGDPSARASYYTGIVRFLSQQSKAGGRLEVPFTRNHWETVYLAQHFPLARGWERQIDLQYSGVLYHTLTPGTYREWLDDNAVSLVALPDVPLDSGGSPEGTLLERPPSYLEPVWRDQHWQVWRVKNAVPLATGPASLTNLGISSFSLYFPQAGTETVRIHSNSMWAVEEGDIASCVSDDEGWFEVTAYSPGLVHVAATVGNILNRGSTSNCGRSMGDGSSSDS